MRAYFSVLTKVSSLFSKPYSIPTFAHCKTSHPLSTSHPRVCATYSSQVASYATICRGMHYLAFLHRCRSGRAFTLGYSEVTIPRTPQLRPAFRWCVKTISFSDGRALLVNFKRGTVLHHFNFKKPVKALCFSPDGRYVTVSSFVLMLLM